jgi:AraC-like DNA-binding protein
MKIELLFDSVVAILLIGLFLGFLLSYFYIKNSIKDKSPNFYMGLFILCFTLIMLEGWFNYSRLIFKCLYAANFSEPLNFSLGPLIYLFTKRSLKKRISRKDLLHFVPVILWLCYCMFFYLQPIEFKYNSIVDTMQLNIQLLDCNINFSDNPLHIRDYVNELTILSLFTYLLLNLFVISKEIKIFNKTLLKSKDENLISLRNAQYHFLTLFIVLFVIKLIFRNDVGDYLLFIYFTFMLIVNLLKLLNESNFFEKQSSFLDPITTSKYIKSALNDEDKTRILGKINKLLKEDKYFLNSNVSLTNLSKLLNEKHHNVSQVINEKLNMTFYELIANYRIEEAKKILKTKKGKQITIEQISEMVGYNSKSTFNTTFKKITGSTPSSFRDT